MEAKKKPYYDELNIYRALIIFWVVLGHAFEEGNDVFGFLHGYAYTFHMPAFFVLSGFLLTSRLEKARGIKNKGLIIFDRAKRLLVPFYFFSAVSVGLKLVFNKFANNPIDDGYTVLDFIIGNKNPNGGLWFLGVLFVISVILILLSDLPELIVFAICVTARVLFSYFNAKHGFLTGIDVIDYSLYYACFVSAGVVLRRYYAHIERVMKKLTERLVFSTLLSAVLLSASIIISLYYKNFGEFKVIYQVFNIFIWLYLAFIICRFKEIKKPLMTVGNYGMDIYMLGYYVQIGIRVVLLQMLGLPSAICQLLMLVLGLTLPIPLSKYIVRKFKLTSALMLGVFPKKDK